MAGGSIKRTETRIVKIALRAVKKALGKGDGLESLDKKYVATVEYLYKVGRKLHDKPWLSVLISIAMCLVDKAYEKARQMLEEFLSAGEYRIVQAGKTVWHVYPKKGDFYVRVHKTPGGIVVDLPLHIIWVHVFLDTALLSGNRWWSAVRGWLLSDLHYDSNYKRVTMGTTQEWQLLATTVLFPGVISLTIDLIVLGTRRISFRWYYRVPCTLDWKLKNESKRLAALELVQRAKNGEEVDFLTLLTFFLGDGGLNGPINANANRLAFCVGRKSYPVYGERAVKLARAMLEAAGEDYGRLLEILECEKYEHIKRLAEPGRRVFQALRVYIVIAGAEMFLYLNYAHGYCYLHAMAYEGGKNKKKLPENFAELAEREGLRVRTYMRTIKGRNGKVYYSRVYVAGMKELLKYARKHPDAYNVYLHFLKMKALKYKDNPRLLKAIQRLMDKIIEEARKYAPEALGEPRE